MRTHHHHYRGILSGGLLLALCGLLAACGVTTTTGTGAGSAGVGEGTTVVVTPTGIARSTPVRVPTPTTQVAHAAPGAVRLTLDKTAYAPGNVVVVTIENGLATTIEVADHQSDCTFVVLQQDIGSWQPVGSCRLMTVTRLVDLAPGSVTPQKLGIPTGPNAAGTYRVVLHYGATGDTQGGVAYSPTFTVG